MDKENNALKTELKACRKVINNTSKESMRETSRDRERELPRTLRGQVLPSHECRTANNTNTQNRGSHLGPGRGYHQI
jgi:hypothetical protein